MAKRSASTVVPGLRFPEFRKNDGWDTKELRDFSEFVNERVGTTECVPYTVTSGVGLVSQQEKLGRTIAGNSLKSYIVLQRNDFAYNKSATKAFPQGFIARYMGDERAAVPNSIFTCFRTNEEMVDPIYLDNLFSTNLHGNWLRKRIAVGARAHGSLNVSDEDLMSLPVPFPVGPSSIAEQQKIADCLTSLDEVIAAQGRKVEALKAHKRGLMQQIFPREGETRPHLRFPEFRSAPEWVEGTVGDTEPFVTSGSRGWANYYADTGSLFVRITNISREAISLDLADKKFVNLPPEATEGVRTLLKAYDVLISITADIGIIGYFDPADPAPAYINQHIALVRFDEQKVSGKFVAYYLASEVAQRRFRATTDNGAKAGMNLAAVQNTKLVLPSLAEQQHIVDFLSSLDVQLAAESNRLAALKTHKQGLMQQLFPTPEIGQ